MLNEVKFDFLNGNAYNDLKFDLDNEFEGHLKVKDIF